MQSERYLIYQYNDYASTDGRYILPEQKFIDLKLPIQFLVPPCIRTVEEDMASRAAV